MKISIYSGKKANYPVPLVSVEKAFKGSSFMQGVRNSWVIVRPQSVAKYVSEATVCEIQVLP
jgi:hypothetical protein